MARHALTQTHDFFFEEFKTTKSNNGTMFHDLKFCEVCCGHNTVQILAPRLFVPKAVSFCAPL